MGGPRRRPVRRARLPLRAAGGRVADGHRRHARGRVLTAALTDAKGLLALLAGLASWPLAAVRGLPLLGRTLAVTSRISVVWPVVRTAAISLVALVVFGGLFASGDAIFGSWAQALLPHLAWDSLTLRVFVGSSWGVPCSPPATSPSTRRASSAWRCPRGVRSRDSGSGPCRSLSSWALFLAFVVAQAAALFGGHEYIQRTTGLTYADYVHQGFGQLTAATVLTLATVALAVRKAPRSTARERLVLRVTLGALCGLTLVVVASALHRMDLYQQAYGFTLLRVLVDAFELWLGLLLVLVLVAGVRLSGWWLPRAALVSAAAFVLVGGLVNPEAWVAQRNIDRYVATGRLDASYLVTLGADALPTIIDGAARRDLGRASWCASPTTRRGRPRVEPRSRPGSEPSTSDRGRSMRPAVGPVARSDS